MKEYVSCKEYFLFYRDLTRRSLLGHLAAASCLAAEDASWIDLFDGHSLQGWKPSENKTSWKVVNGTLAADGPRSHLFYQGPVRGADFRNFELAVELVTQPQCNSGIYFHTTYQESGFPEKGFEIQINNSALGDGGYLERKRTGSLYGLRNMYKQLVPDEKPFQIRVQVRGKNVQIRLNGQLLVDYLEPTPPVIPAGGEKQRFLDHGTFALQCHNDGSRAFYRSVKVRPLPDTLPAYTGQAPVVDETYRKIIDVGRHNIPMVDYHVHLPNGLTLEKALQRSRQCGIQYGIAANATTMKSDAEAERWLRSVTGQPVFYTLVTNNGQWMRSMSQKTAQRFDYIVADGRQLLSSSSVSPADRLHFVDSLVDETIKRLDTEPIDLYSGLTWLPASIKQEGDQLWTTDRNTKLIKALVKNQVAIELNTIEQLPSPSFIRQAKEAGCKFGFGTGNKTTAELQRCEYGLQMVQTCQLDWKNFFVPGAWWPRAAERRWLAS